MMTRALALWTWWMAHPYVTRFALTALCLVGAVFRLATPPMGGDSPS